MSTKVNRKIIDDYIDMHSPNGLEKLSVKAGISGSTIVRARNGESPTKLGTRLAICRAIGCEHDDLFLPSTTGNEEAS